MPGQPSSLSSRHSVSSTVRASACSRTRCRRGAFGEQIARRALDLALVVGEAEVHLRPADLQRGRPSTRSATMFFSTSVVPPSIVLPRARSSS